MTGTYVISSNTGWTYGTGTSNGTAIVSTTPPPTKEKSVPEPVAGGAPTRTLFTKYAAVIDGFVGQVVYGDQERSTSQEGLIVWQSDVVDTKSAAIRLAEGALVIGYRNMFIDVPTYEDDPQDD